MQKILSVRARSQNNGSANRTTDRIAAKSVERAKCLGEDYPIKAIKTFILMNFFTKKY
jgi:hypothetical protein